MLENEINELVVRAQHHDEEAMESLFRIFKPKVTAISREYFLIGAEFDDLIQEGMIGLYNAICVYNADKNHNFSAYASLLIHRKLQNAVKNANRMKNSPLNTYLPINNFDDTTDDEDGVIHLVIVDDDSDIEQYLLDKEMRTVVLSKVKDLLTDEQYKLLKMFLNGLTYREMSERLNIPSKQVDNTLQAIKKKLRTIGGEI